MYTDNALVMIMLCSHIGAKQGEFKPFTALQWSDLAVKIANSSLKEPTALLNLSDMEIRNYLQIDDMEAKRIKKLLSRGASLAFKLEELERQGINIVTRSDREYPLRLKNVLKKYAPAILYYSGDISMLNYKGIAIIGSRNIDEAGEQFAVELAKKATEEGLIVISGGARGIDSISENAAIGNSGMTVSVIADSLVSRIRKKEIRDSIIQGKRLLLTASNPDAPFSVAGAMNRNKYVYALSNSAFVVASDCNKGGTWAGATENIRNGWVKTFVYNTNSYAGNQELIKMGASPIDVLKGYSITDIIEGRARNLEQISLFGKTNIVELKSTAAVSEEFGSFSFRNDVKTDVYELVISALLDCVKEPKSLDELAIMLNINKSQVLSWVNRALEESQIEKLNKPVRYRRITPARFT